MKITKITLHNLASIEGTATIDFESEPLKSAGIFAISGPTGSGKSTILDALCLALYDKTPRFQSTAEAAMIPDTSDEKINQSDVRNILRRGSSEGFAEVEFIAVDGYTYRSNWSVRRARNNPSGRLQNQTIAVYNLDEDRELQGGKTEVLKQLEKLLGLSYDQFTRTVLLAQNDFATFLKSSKKDKAELLEKLTGTEVYSQISSMIYACCEKEKRQLEDLDNKLGYITLLSAEEVNELSKKKEEQLKQIDTHEKKVADLKKVDEQFIELTKYAKEITSAEEEHKLIYSRQQEKEKTISELKSSIDDFEQKSFKIQGEIEQAIALDSRIAVSDKQLQQTKMKFTVVDNKVKKSQEEVSSSKNKLNQLSNQLLLLYKDLSLPQEVNKDIAEANLKGEMERVTKAIQHIELQLKAIDTKGLLKKQKDLSEARKQQEKLEKTFHEYQLLLKNKQKLETEAFELEKKEQTNAQLIVEKQGDLKLNKLLFEQIEKMFREAQLQLSSDVKELRNTLLNGEPCPVCGSTNHSLEHIQSESQFKVIEKEYKEIQNIVTTLNGEIQALIKDKQNIIDLSLKIASEKKTLEQAMETVLTVYSEEELVEKDIVAARVKIEEEEKYLVGQQELLEQLNNNNQALVKEKDTLQGHKNKLDVAYKAIDEEKLNQVYLLKQLKEIEAEFTSSLKELKSLEEDHEKLIKLRKELLKGLSVIAAKENIEKHRKKNTENLEERTKELQVITNSLSTLEGSLKELKKKHMQLVGLLSNYKQDEIKKTLSESEFALKELRDNLIDLEHMLKKQYDNEKQSKTLQVQREKQKQIYAEWAKLSELFGSAKGDRFKVIAQSYTLQILLLHANKHLSYLARRYRLEQVADSLNLQVIDQDMCDEVRTVYSLSGGESFLISLALALGLASLSSNNLKVESLFIDEGFGSLDSNSLRVAMDALEQLQTQGRKIGVISHVQEMGERIPVQVHLNKLNNGKSTVTITE